MEGEMEELADGSQQIVLDGTVTGATTGILPSSKWKPSAAVVSWFGSAVQNARRYN